MWFEISISPLCCFLDRERERELKKETETLNFFPTDDS